MNTLTRIAGLAFGLVLFAPLWLAPLAIGIALDEGPVLPPEPVYVSFDKANPAEGPFAFDWVGLDSVGARAVVNHTAFKFVLENPDVPVLPDVPPLWARIDGPVVAGTNEFAASRVLEGVGPGKYRVRVQLLSEDGLWSGFSNDFRIEVVDSSQVRRPPRPPTMLRKITREGP